jgi:hypothetical protein
LKNGPCVNKAKRGKGDVEPIRERWVANKLSAGSRDESQDTYWGVSINEVGERGRELRDILGGVGGGPDASFANPPSCTRAVLEVA